MLVGSIFLCNTPARPRVQRAPGLPRALCCSRGQTKCKTAGDQRRENAKARLSSVIASAAKQSISSREERMDCFVALLLAMTMREYRMGYKKSCASPPIDGATGSRDHCPQGFESVELTR